MMQEYAKNWYRQMYKYEDKDTLIELLIQEMEKVNIQRKIEVDSEWVSRYWQLHSNCYMLSDALVNENQQLLQENLELKKHLEELLKELKERKQNECK